MLGRAIERVLGRGSRSAIVPPPPPPVIDFTTLDLKLLASICAFHALVSGLLRVFVGRRTASHGDESAPNQQRSALADRLAYDATAVLYAGFTAITGALAWYGEDAATIGGDARSRLYGYSAAAQALGAATASYEVYNVCVIVGAIPEYRSAVHLGHHVTTCLLALFGAFPFLNYYGESSVLPASHFSTPLFPLALGVPQRSFS